MKSDDTTNTTEVEQKSCESQEMSLARTALRPTVLAGISISHLSNFRDSELGLQGLINELSDQVNIVNSGDTDRLEAMLVCQAHTLDAIFHTTLRIASDNMGDVNAAATYMKLGLKAQAQCRATLREVSKIRNPPMANYLAQANIALTQQVNNATQEKIQENELLEHQHAERLDFGKAAEAIGRDSEMETVGAINRTENEEGQI